jgi:hypothetical protein
LRLAVIEVRKIDAANFSLAGLGAGGPMRASLFNSFSAYIAFLLNRDEGFKSNSLPAGAG